MNSIDKIREDKSTLTTFLEAQKAPWSEVAGTYDINFGHILPKPKGARGLKNRGLLSGIGGILQGDLEFSKSATFSVAVGQEGQRTNIYTAER